MLIVYPQTKTYFAHWKDLSPGSAPVKKHGITVMSGVADAVTKIDDLTAGLLDLSELHAFTLRVDPANFKVQSQSDYRLWMAAWGAKPPCNMCVIIFCFFLHRFSPTASLWSCPSCSPPTSPLRCMCPWTSSWLLWLWPWLRNTDKQQETTTETQHELHCIQ